MGTPTRTIVRPTGAPHHTRRHPHGHCAMFHISSIEIDEAKHRAKRPRPHSCEWKTLYEEGEFLVDEGCQVMEERQVKEERQKASISTHRRAIRLATLEDGPPHSIAHFDAIVKLATHAHAQAKALEELEEH